ncbi:MAG TPA: glycosyltransferase [Gemmatimonadaceae bacterium]|nr:glycosyltransferase [Gemmatimonadaceae bacterium]
MSESAMQSLAITILGLSITSSWGNGHATTYRGLVRELAARGHRVTFLERDVPWYADNRDLPTPAGCRTLLYRTVEELTTEHLEVVRDADAVLVGSYVPDGVAVGEWVCRTAQGLVAFYDIDTPVTLAKLARGDHEYLTPELVRRYDLYLSFTGGPTLDRLERELGSPAARPLYCAVDPALYHPEPSADPRWDLGYMGTYSDDRQPTLDRLLLAPARAWSAGRFVVAGPQYPPAVVWPANVERIEHLPPSAHRRFYTAQRFTLNVTRADMIAAGWSPSVRLFEAAACGAPIVSDWWAGLEEFFPIGAEVLVPRDADEALRIVRGMPDDERRAIGTAARARVLGAHTAAHRAAELECHLGELLAGHAV